MSHIDEHVLIVGGGIAAVRTAQGLREAGFTGRITLLSEEQQLPYDRPPLTKNYLTGKVGREAICLLTHEAAAKLEVQLVLGDRATGLDRVSRSVYSANGKTIHFDRLVVATGASPVRPALFDGYENAHYLRTADDADDIRLAISRGGTLGIIGGGFIGLEIASVAKSAGCRVVVIEAAEAPLIRAIGMGLGQSLQRWHEGKGITFRCGSPAVKVIGSNAVCALELGTGERIEVDALIIGVGQRANVAWLADSGLKIQNGLLCDAVGRTNDPCIFAAGDVACRMHRGVCEPTMHWTAAGDQAAQVAQAICGSVSPPPLVDDHYFWSDQHAKRLQFVGRVTPNGKIVFASGSVEDDQFVALSCDNNKITAVLSLANPKEFLHFAMPLRRGDLADVPTELLS